MASTQRETPNAEPDFRPTQSDVSAMAEVLEGKYGSRAAEIADFFAIYHGERGDAGRAWAWSGVAEAVRSREQARLETN